MDEIYKLTDKELSDVNNLLIKHSKISDKDLCFCGSGVYFSDCCEDKPNFWIPDDYVKSLIGFARSKNWKVTDVPFLVGSGSFEDYYIESHDLCARPDCGNKTTCNSHIYGRRHIEKYLEGTVCKIHNPYSISDDYFSEVGTKKEITFKIFCEDCDNNVFSNIDNPDHDINNVKNTFLHLLRTQSYQYQFVRQDLALSHQLILGIKGVVETERNKSIGKMDTIFNLDGFLANNIRYKYQSELRDKLWDLHQTEAVLRKIPHIHTRELDVSQTLFASGIINPSHDLLKNKIIINKEASLFYYTVPSERKKVLVTIASFDDEYGDMIDQFVNATDYAFKKYFNHLFTKCSLPLSIILPDSFEVTNKMISKVEKKNLLRKKSWPKKPSDLDSRMIFARFLK